MNSNNETQKNKTIREFDIRDIGRFLLIRSWIIAIAAVVCIAISLIYTSQITPKYNSSSSMMIIIGNTEDRESWLVGQQIVQTAPDIIQGNAFCDSVASMLSTEISHERGTDSYGEFIDFKDPNGSQYIKANLFGLKGDVQNLAYFTHRTSEEANYNYIYSLVKSASVDVDEKSPNTIKVTVSTTSPELSYIIANAITIKYQEQVANRYALEQNTFHLTDIYETGAISRTPVNRNYVSNAFMAAAVAIVATSAILVVIFIFDDKIKTPDDIEKHLELNILGAIPDFEVK